MERVETLIKKLQEQLLQNALPGQMLLTVQMLQAELARLQDNTATGFSGPEVAITIYPVNNTVTHEENDNPIATQMEERTVMMLQVDEADIEAELEEIKKNAEAMQQIGLQNKPHILVEEEDDIPTLTHQQAYKREYEKKEINEVVAVNTASINEKLKQSRIDLGDTLTEVPIRDLRKAIGVNDRFLFINELFRGDESFYERSVKTINSFSIFPEAEYWIQRELKVKNGWNESDELVRQFYQLVKRRFS